MWAQYTGQEAVELLVQRLDPRAVEEPGMRLFLATWIRAFRREYDNETAQRLLFDLRFKFMECYGRSPRKGPWRHILFLTIGAHFTARMDPLR